MVISTQVSIASQQDQNTCEADGLQMITIGLGLSSNNYNLGFSSKTYKIIAKNKLVLSKINFCFQLEIYV